MQKTLGQVPAPPAAEEAGRTPAEEKISKETAAPATPEEKPAEVVAAPQEEGKQGESKVSAEPTTEAGEAVKEEKAKEGTSEPAKDEESTKEPNGFKEWLKSKRSQL